jgi:hypothetical protein
MQLIETSWEYVAPWAQVAGPDGYTWTVLPSWPPTQRRLARRGRPQVIITAMPWDRIQVVTPDPGEALATLRRTFARADLLAVEITDPDRRVTWTLCPIDMTPIVLGTHLRDLHSIAPAELGRRVGKDLVKLHAALHQQILVYPLGNPHVHVNDLDDGS